jgi:exo-beta-1,3-glucanase (GH17 family)
MVTPNMDNYSDRAMGGGMNSIAQGVANRNERESGLDALNSMNAAAPAHRGPGFNDPYSRPHYNNDAASYSSSSGLPLAATAGTPGTATPDFASRYSAQDIHLDNYPPHPAMSHPSYHDSPYQNSSLNYNPAVSQASVNPHDIADDGDDGFMPEPHRRSFIPGKQRSNERVGPAAASGAAAGGAAGMLGGVFGKKAKSGPDVSYDALGGSQEGASAAEKSEWLSRQTKRSNKMRWTIGIIIAIVVVLAIVGGVVGGILGSRSGGSGSGSGSSGGSGSPASSTWNTASGDLAANGDLSKDSAEIKALMNNDNLHKVFPAIDYTPWGSQYPLCEKYPPSPNNVTRDMAVLSQLTNTVRLYGIDCNQTEMVLHSIERLELTDMKLWLGVWIDTNQTTNDRQMKHMYQLLTDYKDHSIFKGVIIGNEALFRAGESKAESQQELADFLDDARAQFKENGWDLPIATSDLGDNWNSVLVSHVDFVMANIHPFFAGVNVDEAAGWTWSFWQNHNVPLTAGSPNVGQIISETGWPSGGGTDCGGETGDCAPGQSGAVASVENMNIFMEDWVCQAIDNGTDYFWYVQLTRSALDHSTDMPCRFSAFDEPWKVAYNEPGKEWEDKWGLMDPARELKDGLKIPDCGGKTVVGVDFSKSGQAK